MSAAPIATTGTQTTRSLRSSVLPTSVGDGDETIVGLGRRDGADDDDEATGGRTKVVDVATTSGVDATTISE